MRVDVSDDDTVRAGVASVAERFGRIDIVVNNAGIGPQGTIADNPDDEWRRVFDVNHLREGIRVNAVCPGTADTPWVGRLLAAAEDPEAVRAALEARQPHGRLVTAAEVAAAVAYLASPHAGSTTGVSLAVDGGMQGLRLRPTSGR